MSESSSSQRLYSLDALRGFDMFWIMGAEDFFHELAEATNHPVAIWIATQLSHVDWNGFRFYDLIFPLFLFMSGVSTPYSVGRDLEKGTDKSKLLMRIVKRGLILVLFGIIYNNGLHIKPLEEVRFPSVLGRIGIAYMFASIIYLYASQRFQYVWFAFVLIGYWLLLKFTSAPGFPMGDLTMEGNFASWIDRSILPGRLHRGVHDPEGLVSAMPAIGTGLLGIFAGNFLKNNQMDRARKGPTLAIAGIVCLIFGGLWDLFFPINKNLWTSSFVLYVGGCSLVLLAIFYYIIDVLGFRRWAYFFMIIGTNSILIYMSVKFINWYYTSKGFFLWLADIAGEHYQAVILAAGVIAVKWAFLWFMYQKKVFLRV